MENNHKKRYYTIEGVAAMVGEWVSEWVGGWVGG